MPADIVYYHLPREAGVAVAAISHLYAGFLGIVALDFVNHVAFDWKLARSEGWRKPVKAITRIAYFNCRIFSIIVLGMVLAFTTTNVGVYTDCNRYLSITQWLIVPLLNSASLIFVIRTVSLYGCKRSVTVPVVGLWLIVLAASLASLPSWGTAHAISGTTFCTYDAQRDRRGRLAVNVLYKALQLLLNSVVLLLTLHRLLENGLSGLWKHRKAIGVTPLPGVLISQGFFYFVVAVLVDVTFLVLYFTQPSSNPGLQVVGSAMVFSIQPMIAARLFRTVGKAVNTRHIPTINPVSFDSIPSVTVGGSGANSPTKRKSFLDDACSCQLEVDERPFSLNATPPACAYGTRAVQHAINCVRHASSGASTPRTFSLPMQPIPRLPTPPPLMLSPAREGTGSMFEHHSTLPLRIEKLTQHDTTGVHIRTDTISEISGEDGAANSTFSTGYAASSQLEHATEAERRWPGLSAPLNRSSASSLAATLTMDTENLAEQPQPY